MSIETNIEVQLTGRNRVTSFFRIILILPIVFWTQSLGGFSFVKAHTSLGDTLTIGSFGIVFSVVLSLLFTGQYPSYLLTFNHAILELNTRVSAYLFLLTDRYPSIERNESVSVIFPDIEGGKLLSRGMPLVKWFLAIPLYITFFFYFIVGFFMAVGGWFSILFTGKLPESIARYGVNLISFSNNIAAYATMLVTDAYPSFKLGD